MAHPDPYEHAHRLTQDEPVNQPDRPPNEAEKAEIRHVWGLRETEVSQPDHYYTDCGGGVCTTVGSMCDACIEERQTRDGPPTLCPRCGLELNEMGLCYYDDAEHWTNP